MSREFKELLSMRSMDGLDVVKRNERLTRLRFSSESGLYVIIPAQNEEQDLPLTLMSLARSSTEIMPIVVDNDSIDRTSEFAERMGALVIHESIRGQMSAMQAGIKYCAKMSSDKPFLLTDADTLHHKKWAETMSSSVRYKRRLGAIAFGTAVFENGKSAITDLLRTGYAIGGDSARKIKGSSPRARGPNCAMILDDDHRVLESILTKEPYAFPSDVELTNAFKEVGSEVLSVLRPGAVVFTKGDRFSSVFELLQDLLGTPRIERYKNYGYSIEGKTNT